MPEKFEIVNTTVADLASICNYFDHSIVYQEKKGTTVWKDYDKGALRIDIQNKSQYKILIGSKMAMVFSVCYADAIIWREREIGNAMYLHRIVVNPMFKGQRLFGAILNWAMEHAKKKSLSYIRMDTWANNPLIIDYYKSFGFEFVENFTTPDSLELPLHNRNLAIALLEIKVRNR